ncbi:MAG: 5'-nucleotidase/UDP-sugar diphosphatase [Paraglaciecola sp.]|jgi:5'-nucleotidase/UDP-sugar diphosphatase
MLSRSLLCAVGLVLFCSVSSSIVEAKTAQVELIFAVNMHPIGDNGVDDYAQLATLLSQRRKQSPSSLFIFGGGSLGPSTMSAFDHGSHIIDILNSLEPDVMAVRKREFSYFEDELSLRSYEAAFPIVISNLFDPLTYGNLDGLFSSVLVEKGDNTFGIISITDESVMEEYLLQRVKIFEPQEAINKLAKELRQQGADIIIMIYAKAYDYFATLLSEGTIDLSLRAIPLDENPLLPSLLQHPRNIGITTKGQVLLVHLNWEKNQGGSLQVNTSYIPLKNLTEDPLVSSQIQQYTHRLDRLLNQRIGTLMTAMDTQRNTVRTQEAAFGNFVADAIKAYTQADIGLINSGAIRGEEIYQLNTPLTRRHIAKELPFRSRVAVLKIKGQQLIEALENGFSTTEEASGKFPQVSGIQVTYDPLAEQGARVISTIINGKTLNLSQFYTLATSDYLADGGDNYFSFTYAQRIDYSNHEPPLISDVVVNAIQKKNMISPRVEQRIISVEP